MLRVIVGLGVCLAVAGCEKPPRKAAPAAPARAGVPGIRIDMAALHDAGGVPPGWHLTPPPGDPEAGRQAFADLGCDSCHLVRGPGTPPTSPDEKKGPELTTMGGHHPPEYFVESIINPDAVLIEGPGYIGADGHSTMPAYPDLTVAQLADLVAYLQTLSDPGASPVRRPGFAGLPQRPAPPEKRAGSYLVQTYDVKPGQLAAFEAWFRDEGRAAFLALPGLVSVETYVDNTRAGAGLITMLGFVDDAALGRFTQDASASALKQKLDEFSQAHGHQLFRTPPVYRVDALSTP